MNMKSSFSLQKRFQFSLPSPNYLFPVTNHSCFRRTSLPSKPPKCVGLKATCSDEPKSNRTFKKMLPSPWTHHFHSVFVDVSEMDALRKEIDVVKTKVKNKVFSSGQGIDSTKERVLMIYLLVSLGLAHYFEEEINETLKEGLEKMKEIMGGEKDLYTVSIIFWVFRTYGHYISSDVFRRFKGNDGNFKESLKGDAKGILSLYEASHMLTPTDHILEEALSFTSSHLEDLAAGGMCPTHLSMRIRNALTLSQRWNMEIITSMEYISSYYEQEKDHDEMLLRFAKLNFKFTQLHYLQDLKILTKWFKEQEFESKLPPYFKERIVENYFFVLALFFEPHLSHARIMCTQYFIIFGIIDDTFDRYASLPEAESLLNSIERWAPDHTMDKQPYYLKYVLKFILESVEEFGKELSLEVRSYSLKANIEEIKLIAKANFKILKWAHEGHVPSFERYMEFGLIEHTAYASFACFFMCMGNKATKEVYEWLKSRPKILESACIKLRLLNDIYGFEDDMSRGYTPNAVNCYMKQYGVTKEEAVRELLKMVADVEKAINEELLTTPHVVSSLFLNTATALSKMTSIAYNGYEGFTFLEGIINEYMTSLFLDQIRV